MTRFFTEDFFTERLTAVGVTTETVGIFKKVIYDYYLHNRRSFPWRETITPYRVFLSEVMLQQTQAGSRTIKKFEEFLTVFSDFTSLSAASLRDVLTVWQGLGYNRRALALKKAAEIIVEQYGGVLPSTIEELDALPGIGPATASSIVVFAFNKPEVFIETNIRSVFIHFFFRNVENVSDTDLFPLIGKTLDKEQPREWYYALMDYGAMLKKREGNPSRKSKHHVKQSIFEGSDRQLRGKILAFLTQHPEVSIHEFTTHFALVKEKALLLLATLEREGFVIRRDSRIALA